MIRSMFMGANITFRGKTLAKRPTSQPPTRRQSSSLPVDQKDCSTIRVMSNCQNHKIRIQQRKHKRVQRKLSQIKYASRSNKKQPQRQTLLTQNNKRNCQSKDLQNSFPNARQLDHHLSSKWTSPNNRNKSKSSKGNAYPILFKTSNKMSYSSA